MERKPIDRRSLRVAHDFVQRAWRELQDAKDDLKSANYADAVTHAQLAIELSVKAIFLLLKGEYPRKHEFKEEEFEELLKTLPSEIEEIYNIPRVYLISRFWAQMYTVSKYGLEKLGVGADALFKKGEAELAEEHAWECHSAASAVLGWAEDLARREGEGA